MIISHQCGFAFIHIYKTGGTSVARALLPYGRLVDRLAEGYPPTRTTVNAINRAFNLFDLGNSWLTGVGKHATARQVRAYLGDSVYRSYLSFAFVRNPWDWQCSHYHFVRGWRQHRDHTVARQLSFGDFLEREVARGAPTQSDFLTDEHGALIVDRVGRFESLATDLQAIARELGLPPPRLKHLNRSIRPRAYSDIFDARSVEIVRSHFRTDIERFGYRFEA